jgi:hypothetical protein
MDLIFLLFLIGLMFYLIQKMISWHVTTRKWREYYTHDACGYTPIYFFADGSNDRCPKCGRKTKRNLVKLGAELEYIGWTKHVMREKYPFIWEELKDE